LLQTLVICSGCIFPYEIWSINIMLRVGATCAGGLLCLSKFNLDI